MTRPVACLDAERRNRRRPRDCEVCARRADGMPCVPHRLDALAHLLRDQLEADSGVLLVSAEVHRATLVAALAALDPLVAECMPATERNAR